MSVQETTSSFAGVIERSKIGRGADLTASDLSSHVKAVFFPSNANWGAVCYGTWWIITFKFQFNIGHWVAGFKCL